MKAIVVLGAPLVDGELTEVLWERTLAATELYRATGIELVIATGGPTRGSERAEADALVDALTMNGVPAIAERRAMTTRENAQFTAAILRERGVRSAWIVTHAFHAPRARYLFSREGIATRAYTVQRTKLAWLAREAAAWGKLLVTSRSSRR